MGPTGGRRVDVLDRCVADPTNIPGSASARQAGEQHLRQERVDILVLLGLAGGRLRAR